MEINYVSERKTSQCGPQRVLDHYFNVRLGISGP